MSEQKINQLRPKDDGTNVLTLGGYENGPKYEGVEGGCAIKDGQVFFSFDAKINSRPGLRG